MKTNRPTNLNFATDRIRAVSLLVASLTSFGMIGPVTAQQAASPPPVSGEQSAPPLPPPLPEAPPAMPPPAPDRATEPTSVRGTVSQYIMNPDGLVDGILLSEGTIVRTPPHVSQQLVQSVKPQDIVSVDGFMEYPGTIRATAITNPAGQKSVLDVPPSPGNLPPETGPEARQPINATGAIKVLMRAPRGEIDGAVLDNGAIVHFPPPVGTQYANLFLVGAPIAAAGYGTVNTYGRSLEATSIGPSADHLQAVAAVDSRPRGGPEKRHRPGPVPAQ